MKSKPSETQMGHPTLTLNWDSASHTLMVIARIVHGAHNQIGWEPGGEHQQQQLNPNPPLCLVVEIEVPSTSASVLH